MMLQLIREALEEYLLEAGFLITGGLWFIHQGKLYCSNQRIRQLNAYQATGQKSYVGCILLDEMVAHIHGRQLEYTNPAFFDLLDREIALWPKGV